MRGDAAAFRHEALLYAGANEFVDHTVAFIEDAALAGEPVLVAVESVKLDLLRARLDGRSHGIDFVDMKAVGRNPARIIPVWRDFVGDHRSMPRIRGIGEPVWAGRSPAEIDECQRHEALLNLAFGRGREFWLLCPYDTAALDDAVIDAVRVSHPAVWRDGATAVSAGYAGGGDVLGGELADLGPPALAVAFGAELAGVREMIAVQARRAGLDRENTAEVLLASGELMANSLSHGGGRGELQLWFDAEHVHCEVRDEGRIEDPMVGRVRPPADASGGRGLWIANHLCDLVQIRSGAAGTTVRIRIGRA